jgi:hypothetical protein
LFRFRLAVQKLAYSWNEYAQPRVSLLPIERTVPPLPNIDPGIIFFSSQKKRESFDYF